MEKFFLKNTNDTKNIQPVIAIKNSEENIIDLLSLANEELERKSKLINELQSRIEYLEANNIDLMNENQLNQLKNFYGTKLSSIVSALSNFSNYK
jgi:hypothetical protein